MVMIITQEEFELCIPQYQRLIITVCLAFTRNYFDAEDLAQETFLSAFKSLSGFGGNNLKGWLTAIAANKCRDYIKSPGRRLQRLSQEELNCLEDSRGYPTERAEENAVQEKILRLCGKLKEPYRDVATGYFCEDKKLSDIAAETGQSLKTLQTRLYRSKKILKILWKEELP
jgi:RNA polymerase sigma-70 factor (ECF subfamily)